ncbi:MAG TPA: SOS response-associated peptidase [Chryseolinea sp.]|nr:SOS response-associated peptidase [Chryseolinea sp.]
MCYHKSQVNAIDYLADYYSASYSDIMAELYTPHHHENGYDFLMSPVVTAAKPDELLPYHWGFVPWWTKSLQDGIRLRTQTLNCISEEMFDKSSFKDAARQGQRCLIPCSGFFEWRWMDAKGKTKVPYYVSLQNQPLFSIGGLYSSWKDKASEQKMHTYTVLTTKANPLMEKIHNNKKRMPVIIPRQYEKDWLNPNLTEEDVLALCQPIDQQVMRGYTITKLITSKNDESDVPQVLEPMVYPEVMEADSGTAEKPQGDSGKQTELF